MLNGAAGHGYGAHGLWGFFRHSMVQPGSKDHLKKAVWDGSGWREALHYPGGAQLAHYARYFRSIAWWNLEPAGERISIDGRPRDLESLTDPHMAASGAGLHVVYVPAANAGKRVAVRLLPSGHYAARRIDPREGSSASLPGAGGTGWQWTVPDAGDWVIELKPQLSALAAQSCCCAWRLSPSTRKECSGATW
jgi:hypothetical protein